VAKKTPQQSASAKALTRKVEAEEKSGPKFYSIDGEPVHVSLPDGRKAIVGEDPRSLPRAMWRAALAAGCASSEKVNRKALETPIEEAHADQSERRKLIDKAINEALDAEEGAPGFENAFLPSGAVNMTWLNARVGFQVERSERDEATRRIQESLDREEEEGEQDADDQDLRQQEAIRQAQG
jgi:hypothetical protein